MLTPLAAPTRDLLEATPPHYLARGRLANADVRLVECGGKRWVVKDFRCCPGWVRHTVGRWFIRRELKALQRLQGIPGIAENPVRVDTFALAYWYVEGRSLNEFPPGQPSAAFFMALEAAVKRMHARGIAHLDLRNRGNVLVGAAEQPVLIDFQSYVRLPRWIPPLARYLEKIDLSGVYKAWEKSLPGTLDETRQHLLDSVNAWRKWWVLKGYLGMGRLAGRRRRR
jgi:RIO-like serine/threonine protein kinase